jgi:hypothetical protein
VIPRGLLLKFLVIYYIGIERNFKQFLSKKKGGDKMIQKAQAISLDDLVAGRLFPEQIQPPHPKVALKPFIPKEIINRIKARYAAIKK